jgi:hypothetical protein
MHSKKAFSKFHGIWTLIVDSFLGMISTATAGGTVTNFSNRFTLTGMTGVFSAAVTTALAAVSGTSGPATVNNVAAAGAAGGAGTAAEGAWGTPYNEQEGLTKYAPMQPVPPTAITATNTSPLWPTSSVVFASTYLPIPSIVTTLTQANTFSVSSHANTVRPFLGNGIFSVRTDANCG